MAERLQVQVLSAIEPPLEDPANYYLVSWSGGKLLVDAGPRRNPGVEADYVVVTHWHWDHVYGLIGLAGRVKSVCITKRTLEYIDERRALERMRTVALAVAGRWILETPLAEAAALMARRYGEVREALEAASLEEPSECPPLVALKAEVLACPGHSDDHICIVAGGYAFAGDNVVPGRSVTLTDLDAYTGSAYRLLGSAWTSLMPGHGRAPLSRLEVAEYFSRSINSKRARLCRVLSAIGDDWTPLSKVIAEAYPGIAENPGLTSFVAARSLIGYLGLLERAGLVEVDRSRYPWRVRRRAYGRG